MRFAIFLDNINLEHAAGNAKRVYLFDLFDDLIVAAGNELLFMRNANYVLLWLLSRKVICIYIDGLEENLRKLYTQAGIEVKALSKIKENPLLEAILFAEGGRNP